MVIMSDSVPLGFPGVVVRFSADYNFQVLLDGFYVILDSRLFASRCFKCVG